MRYLAFLIIVFMINCNQKKNPDSEVIVSFSDDFGSYVKFEEIIGGYETIVQFELYSVPDSLSHFYAYRDSLISSAVNGNIESRREMIEKKLDEGFSIDQTTFTLLRKYMFVVPLDLYKHNYEKIIWDKKGSNSVYLPNLDIVIYF